jgi:hypothetical protein
VARSLALSADKRSPFKLRRRLNATSTICRSRSNRGLTSKAEAVVRRARRTSLRLSREEAERPHHRRLTPFLRELGQHGACPSIGHLSRPRIACRLGARHAFPTVQSAARVPAIRKHMRRPSQPCSLCCHCLGKRRAGCLRHQVSFRMVLARGTGLIYSACARQLAAVNSASSRPYFALMSASGASFSATTSKMIPISTLPMA